MGRGEGVDATLQSAKKCTCKLFPLPSEDAPAPPPPSPSPLSLHGQGGKKVVLWPADEGFWRGIRQLLLPRRNKKENMKFVQCGDSHLANFRETRKVATAAAAVLRRPTVVIKPQLFEFLFSSSSFIRKKSSIFGKLGVLHFFYLCLERDFAPIENRNKSRGRKRWFFSQKRWS